VICWIGGMIAIIVVRLRSSTTVTRTFARVAMPNHPGTVRGAKTYRRYPKQQRYRCK